MSEVRYGSWNEWDEKDFICHMSVTTNPGLSDFKWSHCDKISNLFAGYVGLWKCVGTINQKRAVDWVNYCMNELLENAVKFGNGNEIVSRVGVHSKDDEVTLVVAVENFSSEENAQKLMNVLVRCTKEDPAKLILETMELNATGTNVPKSSLGILSLMGDYGARLGWSLIPNGHETRKIKTRAEFSL